MRASTSSSLARPMRTLNSRSCKIIVKSSQSTDEATSNRHSHLFPATLLASISLPILMPMISHADELMGGYNFTSNTGSVNDAAISFFFFVVIALLSVVTAGVIYLGVMQALDKKQEMDDKQEQGSRLKDMMPSAFKRNSGDAKEQETEFAATGKRAMKAKRDKSKGFGSSEESN